MAHPVSELMQNTMEKIREMMDANTVVGQPISVAGVTVIPVSKISIGYASGGTDFAQKSQKANKDNSFGGGAGMGVNITPVSFLVISDGNVKIVGVEPAAQTPVEKAIDMVPTVVDKVSAMVKKNKGGETEDDLEFDVYGEDE